MERCAHDVVSHMYTIRHICITIHEYRSFELVKKQPVTVTSVQKNSARHVPITVTFT